MLFPSVFNDYLKDDFFDDFCPLPFDYRMEGARQMKMKTDCKDCKDRYELTLQLPGFKKEEVRASLRKGYLTIEASHTDSKEEKPDESKKGEYVFKETYSGQLSRSFYVGEELKQEDIKASFQNGELIMVIPKKESKEVLPEAERISIE